VDNIRKKYVSMGEIDWSSWAPVERATLLFVIRDGKVLLIHKKLGLGAGKINGPGGRIDPGETPLQAAVREVQEELMVTPPGVREAGELLFQFTDGHSIHRYVFTATDCAGEPRETREAIPLWVDVNEIPYHRMWADDRIWVPLMLANRPFRGRFLFREDQMLACEMDDL
jgi:8-oxo-dGTP diphosphatase